MCISPTHGRSRTYETRVRVTPEVKLIIQDSGAFSDKVRVTFAEAWERQNRHAEKYQYAHLIEARATYDWLIDEVWQADGLRYKQRWSEQDAELAVDETVTAAQFATDNRASGERLVISAQGVTAVQYLRCLERLMPYFRDGDILGLGGWCVIGKFPAQMMPVFSDTLQRVMPFASREGIRRVHIWGVIYPPALGLLYWHAQQHGIVISTDSAGPGLNPVWGQWGYGEWRDNSYRRPDKKAMGAERARHVRVTRAWLHRFGDTRWPTPYVAERRRGSTYQLAMF